MKMKLTLTPEIEKHLARIPSLQEKVDSLGNIVHIPESFSRLAYKAILGEKVDDIDIPYWDEWALKVVQAFQKHSHWDEFLGKLSVRNKWDAMMGVLMMGEVLPYVINRIHYDGVASSTSPQDLERRLEISKEFGWSKSIQQIKDEIAQSKQGYRVIKAKLENISHQVNNVMADIFSKGIPSSGQDQHVSFRLSREEGLDFNFQIKDRKVSKIFDRLGALQQIGVSGQQAQTKQLAQKDLEYGNSLPDLIFEEYLLPDELFSLAFVEEKLLQYKSGRSSTCNGTVVVCLDMSDSMAVYQCNMLSGNGERMTTSYEVAAKALVLRLYQIAVQQKRRMCCVLFSGAILDVVDFDEVKFHQISERILKRHASGGTNFYTAIHEALDLIEGADLKASGQYKGADIIFVTDGEDRLICINSIKDQISDRKQRTRTKIRGVSINDGNANIPRSFDYFCDEAIAIDFSNLQTLDKVVNL